MAIVLLVATSLYAGFQWTIRVVVYPQFASVPGPSWPRYEARHQRLLTWAVGPLFVLDGAAVIIAFALGAVPQHRTLSAGFDTGAYRTLLRVDSARLAAALGAVAAAVWYAH